MKKYKCKTCGVEFNEYTNSVTCGVCCGDGDNDGPCFQCGGNGEYDIKHIDICQHCLRDWYEENED